MTTTERRPTAEPTDVTAEDTVPDDVPLGIGDRLRTLLASSGETKPLYPRLLRLRNIHPNGWQRALLVEGMVLLGALAALADRATSWAPLILPVAAAAVVKFHDVLAGVLPARADTAPPEGGTTEKPDDPWGAGPG